jgi:hypothetical protein
MPLFGKNKNRILANYDWVDLASMTGYKLYDVMLLITDGETIRAITDTELSQELVNSYTNYGMTTYNVANTATQTFTAVMAPFSTSVNIKGRAYLRCTSSADDATDVTNFVKTINFYKNETELIATKTIESKGTFTHGTVSPYLTYIDLPQTKFKKDDYLSITCVLTYTNPGAGTIKITLTHDPSDRQMSPSGGTVVPQGQSRFFLAIPYKLET